MSKLKILAVDDEPDILELLSYNLERAGFSVIGAKDGAEAIETAKAKKPALVILDIMMPGMDGMEALKRLKGDPRCASIPVVMLTAKGEEVDRIVGLELGAEDYIVKPFSPRELLLRVKAVLKRRTSSAPAFSYGELSIDTERHKASVNGNPVKLTVTEFRLLRALFEARGGVLTRSGLLDRAWGEDCYVTERTVDTHIRRLRAKLKKAGNYIETVRGAGYRLGE